MACTEVMSTYIKKLSHPLKEIRERSLQLLVAKLRLGWQLEDELAGTRELLEALLAWFHVQQPSLQKEALHLLLFTIKTKAGTYIARELGIKKIIATLSKIHSKIETDAMETYYDVLETLRFLNTVESEDNVAVPPLTLNFLPGSESDDGSSSGSYNLGLNSQSSKETSISNEAPVERIQNIAQQSDGIKVLLFPWVDLCPSDTKTILLVEDALKLLKSTRRCCRFICDVFLRDFPAEVFLNRPSIVKSLLSIADGRNKGRPCDALHVVYCITRALRSRLQQLSCLDLVHQPSKFQSNTHSSTDDFHRELESLAGGPADAAGEDDALAALKQVPAPVFALDTANTVLAMMARSVALGDTADKTEVLEMKEMNTCLNLVECLIQLLLDCVSESFWRTEHSTKTLRDIAHKSCMVMRLLGDLLNKYRKFFNDDTGRSHHRIAWLRLVAMAERLLHWARHSALPPSTLATALQMAQLDPALKLFYPELSDRVSRALEHSRISVDQEYKSKYRELSKLVASMQDGAQFMMNRNSCKNSKQVLTCIKNSLPVLELHLSEAYLTEISDILLKKIKDFDMTDSDWAFARSIVMNLMAHNIEWVQGKFYRLLADMVRSVLVGDEVDQTENEKCLTLLCDVGILTEVCCHGLSSKSKEVEACASDIMLYLLRGRLVLSEQCWWRLLASLLPVLPLLHVYAAHDTQLGQAICKSLEPDIAECMGVSMPEVTMGLVRLLFVTCPAVQMDAASQLCRLLDDEKYLPPKEVLRMDILVSAIRKLEPEDFNVDYNSSPSKATSTTGLMQILDVLKQDIVLDEHIDLASRNYAAPTLEPSLRRSMLQQLSVILRQLETHDAFLSCDGLKVVVATLRMSMMVEDYLAFPECAISCVSVINSVCFSSRHSLAKIPDLPLLLLRVILVFPANDSAVQMCAQILSLVAWSGFALQELDKSRHRVPALPLSVTERTILPFVVNSYWNTSPNAKHSSIEWLLADEDVRASIRVHWWCACEGGARVLRGAPPPPAPLALRPTARDLVALRASCPVYSCTKALLDLENATSHKQVNEALSLLESYTHLVPLSSARGAEIGALPWQHTRRFLSAPPASSRDAALLTSLLRFTRAYIDNVPTDSGAMAWILTTFLDNDASIISLLSREELYLEQTPQESIEVTQLHINIIKVLRRCIVLLDDDDDYDSDTIESLMKIFLACLQRIDLRNFHKLGYLNELVRCIRYAVNSRDCRLSEDTLVACMRQIASTLAGCAAGGGRKGQACRLDALLTLLALLAQVHAERIPVQRWNEAWNGDIVRAVVQCSGAARPELRAAAGSVMAALAHYPQFLPHLLQAIPTHSLSQYAAGMFAATWEANVVRSAAASLLTALATRASPHTDVLECDIFENLKQYEFLENYIDILVDFCNDKAHDFVFEPNVPRSVLERRPELEFRAQKCGDVHISPRPILFNEHPPPSPDLVAAAADVVFNVSAFPKCPVQAWNDRGLFRLLFRCASWSFRCASWSKGSPSDVYRIRLSTCRALAAAATHKSVRSTLATTKDCLLALLTTLTPLEEEVIEADKVVAQTQVFMVLATLLSDKTAGDTLWRALAEARGTTFFCCLLQGLECDEIELQDATLHCLTQLAQSATIIRPNQKQDKSRVKFLDNLKSPFTKPILSDRQGSGDKANDDCQPEYMVEELCKALIHLYRKLEVDNRILTNLDERWHRVCSCLSSLLAASPRCRLYGVHRQLPRILLNTLQAVRDRLSLQGSADVLRSAAQNPTLRTLHWMLILIDCHMVECPAAKENFADDGVSVSLTRLWAWCMLAADTRDSVAHLLLTFSNDCPKAWGAMSSCIGGRSLASEVCALVCREASLQTRPRSDTLLLLGLKILRHIVPHHHCRNIILKSEAVTSMYKLRVRERGVSPAGLSWARLCEALSRHADGAGALLALRPILTAPGVRALLVPALAHVARHRRAAVLQARDLLELISGTLLAGDTAEVVSATRAVWALAANNHKAKLLLRSAGVAAAVQSALQRIHRLPEDGATQRAMQLLLYTNSILQTT